MLAEERKLKIMEFVRRDNFVSIRQLMDVLTASRSSIMRDLIELEEQGLIIRQRGGASFVDTVELLSQFNELPERDKEKKNVAEKRRICKYAASLIKNGNNIYIDAGTTALYLIDYIIDKEVNIVTPSVRLLSKIPHNFKGKVQLLGGDYIPKYDSVAGTVTAEQLAMFHFDISFLTCNGIDMENDNVSAFHIPYAMNKKLAMSKGDAKVLLVDASKIRTKGLCTYANLSDFDAVFINRFKYEQGELPKNFKICD